MEYSFVFALPASFNGKAVVSSTKTRFGLFLPNGVSYGIYLWHGTILYFLWDIIIPMDSWAAFSLFGGCTFAWSYLSFRFYETSMNHWVRRKLKAV